MYRTGYHRIWYAVVSLSTRLSLMSAIARTLRLSMLQARVPGSPGGSSILHDGKAVSYSSSSAFGNASSPDTAGSRGAVEDSLGLALSASGTVLTRGGPHHSDNAERSRMIVDGGTGGTDGTYVDSLSRTRPSSSIVNPITQPSK